MIWLVKAESDCAQQLRGAVLFYTARQISHNPLTVNEQLDIIRQILGHFRDNIAL